MPISMPGSPGSPGWRQSHAPQLNALFQRVLDQTGQRGLAEEAIRAAESALNGMYHQVMIDSGGNSPYAVQVMNAHTESVVRLAGLVPQITGDDPTAGSAALREAQQVLRGMGISDPQFMYPWLRANVNDDQVLRSAGLDPQRVRHVDSPWAHADLDGLMGIARQMLSQYRGTDGQRLSEDQISQYIDQAYTMARHHGVGSQFTPPPSTLPPPPPPAPRRATSDGTNRTPATDDGEPPADATDAGFSVQDMNFPRRV